MAIDQIQPQTDFPISRLLVDLGDGVTYYVQAIIRKATDATVLATINLISQGNRLYANTWHTPADSTGRGLYVTITTSAYTDAGYTTKSPNYEDESNTYVIYNQNNNLQFLASQLSALIGTATEINYKKIKQIMLEVFRDFKKELKEEERQEKDYTPFFLALEKSLKSSIDEIKVIEPIDMPPADHTPVIEAIKGSESRLSDIIKNLPPPEKINYDPIIEAIQKMDQSAALKKINETIALLLTVSKRLDKTMPEIGRYFEQVASDLETLKPRPAKVVISPYLKR